MRTDTPHTIMIIPHGMPRTAPPSSAACATSRLAEAANAESPRLEVQCQRANNRRGDDDDRQLLRGLQWFWGLTLV